MNRRSSAVFTATLLGICSLASTSLATTTTYIGMVNGVGSKVVENGGVCSVVALTNAVGGLHQDTNAGGNGYDDNVIAVVGASTNFCNQTITPIIKNGYRLLVNDGNFGGYIFNLGTDGVWATGAHGNDLIANAFGFGFNSVDAGPGNDYIYGSGGTSAFGGDDDDIFCASTGSLLNADGGQGWDTVRNGTAYMHNSIESFESTTWCGLF